MATIKDGSRLYQERRPKRVTTATDVEQLGETDLDRGRALYASRHGRDSATRRAALDRFNSWPSKADNVGGDAA